MIILLMGVTGSGKSTAGQVLADKLCIDFIDADDFHTKENIALMSEGKPLNDEMRKPWLEAIAHEVEQYGEDKKDVVLACSALKRSYRDILFEPSKQCALVYLSGDRSQIEARLLERKNHFMPSNLVDSQFATLQEPEADEAVIEIPISLSVEHAVAEIINSINHEELYSFNPQKLEQKELN